MIINNKNLQKLIKAIRLANKRNKKKLELHEPLLNIKETKYLAKCIKYGYVSTFGKFTGIFENKLSSLTKSKNVICTSSGTNALHIALKCIGIKKNDEIIIPSFNYIASANVILYENSYPVFVDIEESNLGIDAKKLDKFLSKNSKLIRNNCINLKTGRRIKGIIVFHAFGHPSSIMDIIKVAKKYKLKIIEDAAEGIGSFHRNKHLGTFGDIGIISFNGNKTITTGGGGAILTNNINYAKRARLLCSIGRQNHPWKYKYTELGYNYRMPNLNAALGCSQLDKLNYILKEKRKLLSRYKSAFKKFENIKIFEEPKNSKSNYWIHNIILRGGSKRKMENLIKYANKNNIKMRPAWILLHKVNYLKKFQRDKMKISEKIYNSLISIPSSA